MLYTYLKLLKRKDVSALKKLMWIHNHYARRKEISENWVKDIQSYADINSRYSFTLIYEQLFGINKEQVMTINEFIDIHLEVNPYYGLLLYRQYHYNLSSTQIEKLLQYYCNNQPSIEEFRLLNALYDHTFKKYSSLYLQYSSIINNIIPLFNSVNVNDNILLFCYLLNYMKCDKQTKIKLLNILIQYDIEIPITALGYITYKPLQQQLPKQSKRIQQKYVYGYLLRKMLPSKLLCKNYIATIYKYRKRLTKSVLVNLVETYRQKAKIPANKIQDEWFKLKTIDFWKQVIE